MCTMYWVGVSKIVNISEIQVGTARNHECLSKPVHLHLRNHYLLLPTLPKKVETSLNNQKEERKSCSHQQALYQVIQNVLFCLLNHFNLLTILPTPTLTFQPQFFTLSIYLETRFPSPFIHPVSWPSCRWLSNRFIIIILNMQQPKILVAIRKRPLSKKQTAKGQTDIVTVKTCDTVIVSQYKQKVDLTKFLQETIFNFDFAFNQQTHNEEIYDLAVRPLVDSAFQGAKVTCFAYGQTGSGKTYTMNGNMNQGIPGLYTLGANDIFEYLASPQFKHLKAKLSFYQIYCGKLFDLLNKRTELKLREDNKNNINIIGLEEANVSCSQEFIEYLALGSQQRVTSMNSANSDSSRSHAILQISLKDGKKLFGKISFIDLAGNERGADHMDMDKQTRIDGAEINKSLLSLKECIRALDQGKGHTPFRGSKLTMVLKDSFVGFCRTVMIGNVSPSSASSENTLNTLRYADRVKELRKPQQSVTKEDMKAKEMMLPRQNKNAIRIMINNDDDAEDIARKRDQAQKEYGITEEAPPKKQQQQPVKEESHLRKNSFGGAKANQLIGGGKSQKSNSVTKNVVVNNISKANNMVTSQMMNSKGNIGNIGSKQKIENDYQVSNRYEQQVPGMLNRYKSQNTQGGIIRQKQEPMEIESSSTPYYVPNNRNMPNNQKLFTNNSNTNPMRPYQQPNVNNYSGMMNQSANYSGISNNGQMPMNYGYQPNRQPNNGQYNNFTNPNPNFYNNGHNYPNNNYQPNFQPNNSINFMQRGQPQPQPQQQFFQMPEKWEDMVAVVTNSNEPQLSEAVLAQMNKQLFIEEQQLMRNHSQTLRSQIDMIKSQMSLLNDMQIDKSKITSRGYVRFMQDSIEDKLSQLEMLREKLINFTYKLDEMEEIEGLGRAVSHDDEQLLDDIN